MSSSCAASSAKAFAACGEYYIIDVHDPDFYKGGNVSTCKDSKYLIFDMEAKCLSESECMNEHTILEGTMMCLTDEQCAENAFIQVAGIGVS